MTRPEPPGVGGRPSGARAGLSRERILEAAVDLVDAEGLDALSMRRLGKELGVEAMSLYNHVPNKAALLDGLVDLIIAQVPIEPRQTEWTEQIRMMARAYRKVAVTHPNVVPLLAMRPFTGFKELEPIDYAFGCLREAGFSDADALHAFRVLAAFATGYLLSETGGSFGTGSIIDGNHTIDPDDFGIADYPHLQAMIPHMIDTDLDAEFEFGLDAMIEGLKKHLEK